MDLRDLDRWRAYFRSSSTSIFEVIENAISLAALDHPQEFKAQKEPMVLKILTCGTKCHANARKARVQGSNRVPDYEIVNDQDGRKNKHTETVLHSPVACHNGSSTILEGNCVYSVTQQQFLVGLGGNEERCCYIREGAQGLAVKAREDNCIAKENFFGSPKEHESNTVVDGNNSADEYGEALAFVSKSSDETMMPNDMCEDEENPRINEGPIYEIQTVTKETANATHLIEDNENGVGQNTGTLKKIFKIKIRGSSLNQNNLGIMESLKKIQYLDMNTQILKDAHIETTVTPMRKHRSKEIRRLVRAVIRYKEPSSDWHQEPLPESLSNEGVPVSPVDPLKIPDGADEERNFSVWQQPGHDNRKRLTFSTAGKDSKGKQCLPEELIVIEKEQKPNAPKDTENGLMQIRDSTGVQSQLNTEPICTHCRSRQQASQKWAESERKVTEVRVSQAEDGSDFWYRLKHVAFGTHRSEKLSESGDLAERRTSECGLKAKGPYDALYPLKPDRFHIPFEELSLLGKNLEQQDDAEIGGKVNPDSSDVQPHAPKLKKDALITYARLQASQERAEFRREVPTGRASRAKDSRNKGSKRKIRLFDTKKRSEYGAKAKGVVDVQQLKVTQASTKDISNKCSNLKTCLFDTKKRSDYGEKAKGVVDVQHQLKVTQANTKDSSNKCSNLKTCLFDTKKRPDYGAKAKGGVDVQHQLKVTQATSRASHQKNLEGSEDVHKLKLEEAGKKLIAGYQELQNAKKRRAVQVIDLEDAKRMKLVLHQNKANRRF